jgi:type IX secretion system PorP/SprF family membrane protein
MKKTLRRLLLVAVLASGATRPGQAQQQAQYSQYMNNNYILNPGVAGSEDYIDIKFSYRTQWTGLEGKPNTYYASLHSSLDRWRSQSKRTMGDWRRSFHAVGGLAYNDVTGPTSRAGLYVSYAYNMALTPTMRAALGLSVGMQQFAVDGQKLRFHDPNTRAGSQASRVPDATVGLWVYSPVFYAGVSTAQLLGNELEFSYSQVDQTEYVNTLQRHYFITGGVRLPLNTDFVLVPSVLVKSVAPSPLSVDVNAKLKYQNLFWAGASLRAFDSVVALFGLNFTDHSSLSYSYDAGTSRLNGYQWGSHEVLLGLRLKRKAKVVCNDRFW